MPPPFHSNSKPIPFYLGPSGHLSQAVLRKFFIAIAKASAFSFVFFCLSFPHIPYHNRLSEPVVTEYLKTDLVHTPVLIAYSTNLEPTE